MLPAAAVLLASMMGATAGGEDATLRPAPAFGTLSWVQGGPITLDQLRGRAVLVRWWTGPGCPYCRASSATLERWHRQFADDGLTVIGLYHHKTDGTPAAADVLRMASQLGFTFPIAIDDGWGTLRRWWLDGHDRDFTSVTFLIDPDGMISYVHPGGSYTEEEAESITAAIRRILPPAGAAPAPTRHTP